MKSCQLKAGYNLQVETEGQYTLAYDIFFKPFYAKVVLSRVKEKRCFN